jgi:AraC-like DNA-binding protein
MLDQAPQISQSPLRFPTSLSTTERHRRVVLRAIEHMRANLADPHNLDKLSDIACCSRWHLVRVFSEYTGVTPMTFLSMLRFQAAKAMLLETDEKIINIAYDVGFSSLGSFGRRFTELVGFSPRALRQGAKRFDPAQFRTLIRRMAEQFHKDDDAGYICGSITLGLSAQRLLEHHGGGHVFLGVFTGNSPSGIPQSCSIAGFPGPYRLPLRAEGKASILAAAWQTEGDPISILLSRNLLLGRSAEITAGRAVRRQVDLTLDLETVDKPPVLLALPLLLERKARQTGLA